MGVLAVALAMWAAVYLFAYEREYAGVPVEAGRVMVMEGSVEAVSGKSVLFRPDGSRWLYAVSSRDGACPLEAGERYRIRGEAYPLQAPCGPGIFDRERWGYLHGIIAGIRLDEYCRNGPGDWRSRFRAFSLRLRERAASLLREGAPPDDEARQVMVSAVLGDKTDARPETMAKFLESGCMHVFAVSGMHVGVAAMLVLGMLRLLNVHPRAARLACILLLAAYVFMTGMSASALRAFIMATVWLLAFVLRRKGHPGQYSGARFHPPLFNEPAPGFPAGVPAFFLRFCRHCLPGGMAQPGKAPVVAGPVYSSPDLSCAGKIPGAAGKSMPRRADRLRGGVAGFHSPDGMALRNLEPVCSLDQFVPERTCLSPYGHFPVRADVRVVPVDAACLQYGRFLAGVRHAVRSRGSGFPAVQLSFFRTAFRGK